MLVPIVLIVCFVYLLRTQSTIFGGKNPFVCRYTQLLVVI